MADRGEILAPGPCGRPGQGIYLACDDREHPTYGEFGHRIAAALGCRVLVWPLWRWVGRSVGAVAEAVQRLGGPASVLTRDKICEATAANWACSAAKARSQLDFQPTYPLDVRLAETAEWFREHGWL